MMDELEQLRHDQAAAAKAMQKHPVLGGFTSLPLSARVGLVLDSFRNFVTGIGVRGVDKSTANQVRPPAILTYPELSALYIGDGLAKRICDLPASDATRSGWDVDGDPDGKIVKEMDRLRAPQNFKDALTWVRLFGGAVTICLWDDNRPLFAPFKFDKNKPQKLNGLRTHSAAEVWINPTDLDRDPSSARFEMPEYYTIRRVYGPQYLVHWTRVIEWRSGSIPDRTYFGLDQYRRFWGFGVIQAAFESLGAMGISWSAVASLMQESVVGKYKIKNLAQLLLAKDYDAIQQRMANLELSKSVLKGVLLGEGEEYSRDKLEFAGVADVLDRSMMRVSSDAGIPVSLLFGRSAAGMNATGEGDARQYYDMVVEAQNTYLREPVEQLARWLGARIVPETPEEEYAVKFRPVWSMSEKEWADTVYKIAQADSLMKVNGILSPREIRIARYVGRYSMHTSLPSSATEPPPDPMMLQMGAAGGSEEGDGNLAPHATASAVPPVPIPTTKESTKMRSEPSKKLGGQKQGVAQPGATSVHTPREGNSTTGD